MMHVRKMTCCWGLRRNFPILMQAWKLGPALAGGNCVVMKVRCQHGGARHRQ